MISDQEAVAFAVAFAAARRHIIKARMDRRKARKAERLRDQAIRAECDRLHLARLARGE